MEIKIQERKATDISINLPLYEYHILKKLIINGLINTYFLSKEDSKIAQDIAFKIETKAINYGN